MLETAETNVVDDPRPLMAGTLSAERVSGFWNAYLRVGYAVMLVECLGVLGYLAATPADANRVLLMALFSVLSAACIPALLFAGAMARYVRRERVGLASAVGGLLVMVVASLLDGELDSPVVYLTLLGIFYTAVALRPRSVMLVAVLTATGFAVIVLADPDPGADSSAILSLAMLVSGVSVLAVLGSFYRSRLEDDGHLMLHEISRQAATDGLTGCWNHESFYPRLGTEVDQALRYHRPLSLLVCDVDLLKDCNDTYGHVAGDAALARLGANLRSAARSTDFVARVGGDEFALIMPGTTAADAGRAARRLVDRLAAEPAPSLSVSIGVAELCPEVPTPLQLFRRADGAMYEAKETGRGGVVVALDRRSEAGAEVGEAAERVTPPGGRPACADRRRWAELVRRAEREETEASAILRALTREAPVGFAFVDRDLRVVWANPALVTRYGRHVTETVGMKLADGLPELWPQMESAYRQALAGSTVRGLEVRGPAGVWVVSLHPVTMQGQVVGVGAVAFDITDRERLERAQENLTEAVVTALVRAEEARDPYTAGHQERVSEIAAAIAIEMGSDASMVKGIRLAGQIHDIGKLSVPTEILSKPTRLSGPEMEVVRGHSAAGHEILKGIDFPWPVADMVVQHHERMDGSGYPSALRGDDICVGARILAVADTVEAMSADRPYRAAPGIQSAFDVLADGRETLFDPAVVDACVRLWRSGRLPLPGMERSNQVVGLDHFLARMGRRAAV